ncbi:helix-turn-helix domain-containing protein [Hymenobacter sp. CRA2]|uniref:helix-turn-helix domain-containing protein n=1 Tax=Hymenobacter sp. CRA2 TaxID=1955620 RepID=UPI00098FA30A|nr:hypothetical protein B0919_08665 [Hymenobacter sp. CRA2]
MLDRIRQLIQTRQLSPTQFADAIGVARPIISHILSGRNKPSLEVVQRIIAAFPDVAMPWLLTGQGPMLASDANKLASEPLAAHPPAAGPAGGATRAPRPAKSVQANTAEVAPASASAPGVEAPSKAVDSDAPMTSVTSSVAMPPAASAVVEPVASPTGFPELPTSLTLQPKTIRRVLVFYSDGTFTDFTPAPGGF